MPKTKKLQKSLQDYLSKLKNPNPQIKSPFNSLSSSKNFILSACKRPKTPSFAIDGQRNNNNNEESHKSNDSDAATLSDVDRFLFENFKSLYLREEDDEEKKFERNTKSEEERLESSKFGPILFDSPRFDIGLPPDLRGSNRFFVTPGSSGSLVEDARTSSGTTTGDDAGSTSTATTATETLNDFSNSSFRHRMSNQAAAAEAIPRDFIAVLTYSPSPYEDFRRSMQDMVEAKFKNDEKVDWDFMEELLFSYLNLNDKKSHRFVLSAFADLVVGLRRRPERDPATAKPRSVRTFKLGREEVRRRKMKEATSE